MDLEARQDIRWHREPGEAGMSREVLEQGLAEARRGLEAGLHRGVQGYIGRHGQPVLEYALGEARAGTPLSVDSIVPWFSSGKPVVAMAVALLFERGRLGLDDPVHRYLPRFPRELGACTLRH
ncbi:MAG: beta-lactamase family protein, partial [Deltaproteobacteria bacterium]|nr:beta-lactamase family protein [Deltaproteobacteria bacterium]